MKTPLIKFVFLIIVSLVSLNSCSNNNNDDYLITNDTQTQIEGHMKELSWHITKYIDSGNNEISHFTGYNFTFGANNVLTATNGTNTYIGTWSITDSNSNDDS